MGYLDYKINYYVTKVLRALLRVDSVNTGNHSFKKVNCFIADELVSVVVAENYHVPGNQVVIKVFNVFKIS